MHRMPLRLIGDSSDNVSRSTLPTGRQLTPVRLALPVGRALCDRGPQPGSVIAAVREGGTFASLTASAMFDGSSGTGGLRGLRGTVSVAGAATGPTTLAGSYEGRVHVQAIAVDDD